MSKPQSAEPTATDSHPNAKTRLISCIPFFVLGSAFIILAFWSWRKWADITVDFGNELYVPWRLSEGEHLYRDLAFSVGPLSQYFNALLFRLFGVSLSTLIYTNLIILAGITLLIYRLFRTLGNRFEATLIGLVFLSLFGFSQYTGVANYNYLCPYRHEMPHGIALCLLQIFCLIRFTERRTEKYLALAGACCGAIALMKAELFLASGTLSVVAAVLLLLREHRKFRFLFRASCIFLAGLFAPILLMLAYLSTAMPLKQALAGSFANWFMASNPKLTTAYPMYIQLMGFDAPWANLMDNILYCLAGLILIISVYLFDYCLAGFRHSRKTQVSIGAGLGIISFFLLRLLVPVEVWFRLAQILPLVSLISGLTFAWHTFRQRNQTDNFHKNILLTLWATLSLMLLPKMLLNAQLSHYGFVLAMPATLLLVALVTILIPRRLHNNWGTGELFRAVMLALLLNWALPHLERSNLIYRQKTRAIGTGGDITYHDPVSSYRNAIIPRVIDDLRKRLPEDATLLVLPNGININYLLRKRNPTPHFLLTPFEILVSGGEAEVLKSFQRTPPDYILVIIEDMQGHGYRFFGDTGYGDQIIPWVEAHYTNANRYTVQDHRQQDRYVVFLYQRKHKKKRETSASRFSLFNSVVNR